MQSVGEISGIAKGAKNMKRQIVGEKIKEGRRADKGWWGKVRFMCITPEQLFGRVLPYVLYTNNISFIYFSFFFAGMHLEITKKYDDDENVYIVYTVL